MTRRDREEFRAYLRNCTDRQVQGVFDKESAAGRNDYAEIAVSEANRRGITLEPYRIVGPYSPLPREDGDEGPVVILPADDELS